MVLKAIIPFFFFFCYENIGQSYFAVKKSMEFPDNNDNNGAQSTLVERGL